MPVTVRIDPTANSKQAQVIVDATPSNDGVMTKVQAAKLEALSPSGTVPQSGIIAVTPSTGTNFALTFATPFPASYLYKYTITVSPDDPNAPFLSYDVVSRTQAGMVIRWSQPFTGSISWSVQ